jgi:hypothetical protein
MAAYFDSLFESMISFENECLQNEPIGLFYEELAKKSSDLLLMSPSRKCEYIKKLLDSNYEANLQPRKPHERLEMKSHKRKGFGRKGKVSVGVQCSDQTPTLEMDRLTFLNEE